MKNSTKEEYKISVLKVMLYIEENYKDDLTLEELAKTASFSKYHFHRIFKHITNETISDYIRRIRLQSTTLKLKSKENITSIALNSGYETNSSFSKAFKKHFGLSPKEFSFHTKKIQGNIMIKAKYQHLEKQEILYVRKTGAYTKAAEQAWSSLMPFVYKHKIKNKKNLMGKNAMMFGIGHDNPHLTEQNLIRYDACISWDDKSVKPEGEILSKNN